MSNIRIWGQIIAITVYGTMRLAEIATASGSQQEEYKGPPPRDQANNQSSNSRERKDHQIDEIVDLESLTCPITQELIVEPATTIYGHLFELSAIKHWVQKKGKCPLTQKPLTIDQITPQYALKATIEEMRAIKMENMSSQKKIEELEARLNKRGIGTQKSDLSDKQNEPAQAVLTSAAVVAGASVASCSQQDTIDTKKENLDKTVKEEVKFDEQSGDWWFWSSPAAEPDQPDNSAQEPARVGTEDESTKDAHQQEDEKKEEEPAQQEGGWWFWSSTGQPAAEDPNLDVNQTGSAARDDRGDEYIQETLIKDKGTNEEVPQDQASSGWWPWYSSEQAPEDQNAQDQAPIEPVVDNQSEESKIQEGVSNACLNEEQKVDKQTKYDKDQKSAAEASSSWFW